MKRVQDIMAKDVVTANPQMPVAVAAKLMLEEDVGCLVVIGGKQNKGNSHRPRPDVLCCGAS